MTINQNKQHTAYIGLGANLGAPKTTLVAASDALGQLPDTRRIALSPFYRSAPVQASGPDYVNAVAALATSLDPFALLAALQQLEQQFGRVRSYVNAPRTLDLDLLLYDEQHISSPTLTVPHPRMHERAFVLRPLADIAPDLLLPQGALHVLLAQCEDQDIELLSLP